MLESVLHLFAECPHALALWRVFQPVYVALQPAVPFVPWDVALLLNVVQGPPLGAAEHLILTITFASWFAVAGAVCSVAAGELLLRLPLLPHDLKIIIQENQPDIITINETLKIKPNTKIYNYTIT